jgi:hypothetical protein
MIKLAVTPPKERWAAIDTNVKIFGWDKDAYLQNYGMKINTQVKEVSHQARYTHEALVLLHQQMNGMLFHFL